MSAFRRFGIAFGLVLVMLQAPNAAAMSTYVFCREPRVPSCTANYGAFFDEADFDRCKREMEDYRDDVKKFIDCLQGAAANDIREVQTNYSDAVDSFNRRVGQ